LFKRDLTIPLILVPFSETFFSVTAFFPHLFLSPFYFALSAFGTACRFIKPFGSKIFLLGRTDIERSVALNTNDCFTFHVLTYMGTESPICLCGLKKSNSAPYFVFIFRRICRSEQSLAAGLFPDFFSNNYAIYINILI
jgi:hypothetical protein